MATPLLTELEMEVIQDLADVWNKLNEVVEPGPTRGADLRELMAHIHELQRAVMAQAAAREYPDLFRPLGGVLHNEGG